jgi:hypothetical protein
MENIEQKEVGNNFFILIGKSDSSGSMEGDRGAIWRGIVHGINQQEIAKEDQEAKEDKDAGERVRR